MENVRKSLWLLAVLTLLLLFIAVGLFLHQSFITSRNQQSSPATPSPQISPSASSTYPVPPPKLYVETYELKAPLPSIPPNLKQYTFKVRHSLEEVSTLGRQFGLTETKIPNSDLVLAYNISDPVLQGLLVFRRSTGGFSYISYDQKRYQPSSASASLISTSLTSTLALFDDTISCPVTYQRQSLPGVTFIECHRDWQKVGLPILSAVGILNTPQTSRLSDLELAQADALLASADPDIITTSINQNALARPDDFNTMTIGLGPDGRVVAIDSNIRPLDSNKPPVVLQTADLLSPREALDQFRNHQSTFSLTIPAGSGTPDVNKVYSQGLAHAKKATITDYLLTYVEKPALAVHQRLVPMYLIRGTAELDSLYTVRFVELLPALRSGESSLASGGLVAGVTDERSTQDSSLKLGTFFPTDAPTPSPTGPLISKAPPSTSIPCDPAAVSTVGYTSFYNLPGIGTIAGYVWPTHGNMIYVLLPGSLALPSARELLAAFYTRGLDSDAAPIQTLEQIQAKLEAFAAGTYCEAIVISGPSPFIYLYPEKEMEVGVTLGGPVSYSYPSLSNNTWSVVAEPKGSLSNLYKLQAISYKLTRLYYEYDKSKVSFTEPKEGFVVKSNEWEGFIRDTLSPQLGLTKGEEDDLVVDIRNALSNPSSPSHPSTPSSPYLKLSFVSREELDEKLPLTITPLPTTLHRIHLLLTPLAENTRASAAPLARLGRGGFVAIEIGATLIE